MTSSPRRRVFVDDLPKTHDVRYGLVFLLGLAVSAVALYAIGYFVAGDKLPSGTTIAGVDVGGMTPDQATVVVQAELAPRIEQPLSVVAAGRTSSLDPQRAGLAFDIEASVSGALRGSSWDPRHMLQVLMGGHAVEPALVVDRAELNTAVGRIADDVAGKPRDAAVSFATGRPQVEFGRTGQQLDRHRAKARLISAVRAGRDRVVVPVTKVEPQITDAEATTFADAVGNRAVDGDISLRVDDSTVTVEPDVFASALTTQVIDSDLRLAVDAQRLYARSRPILASLASAPVDATIRFGRNRPVVVPGRRGATVSKQNWADAVLAAVSSNKRRASVTTTTAAPAFTTADARRLRVRTRVATGSSRLPSAIATANLTRAARQLDGTLLKPGETLSLLARVDVQGNKRAASVVAGATYTAAFRAGLTVLQRTPVVYYTGGYPEGLGARVAPPGHDLVVRNDSPYGVYVSASTRRSTGGDGLVEVNLWSSPYWQVKVHASHRHSVVKPRTRVVSKRPCFPRPGITGFDIDLTRVFWRSGKRVDSDVTSTSYAPRAGIRCG